MTAGAEGVGQIAGINRYPVKSMLGEQLQQAVVATAGIVGNRGYAVIDEADGKVASARTPASGGRCCAAGPSTSPSRSWTHCCHR